ncbi:MAG: DNA repair protein RecN [Kiritimatiellae bacterium]|nr:DNA repair protein RecN [Kiritimatiellia bacterium]
MLQTLRVKNLALVENIRVDFRPGLNVITGETGAGKSVLIGALGLLLGERADKTLIRAGADAFGAEALFVLPDTAAVDAVLREAGLDPCEDGQLIIRRIMGAAGSSRNFVNASPTTLQVLKKLGDRLVDMHGPHDHQSLLDPGFQLDLLDAFGHLEKERGACEQDYAALLELERKRRALACDAGEAERQTDMLAFQVKEIEDAGLTDGEDEELAREHLVVANAQRLLELAGAAVAGLTDAETSAFDCLAAVQQALDEMSGLLEAAGPWREEARSIAIQIQELSNTVSSAAQNIEADPGRLEQIEARLALYHNLKRKYGGTTQAVLERLNTARERLHDLTTRAEQTAELDRQIAQARARLQAAGERLRDKRQPAAARLAKAITAAIQDLGLAKGEFTADLTAAAPTATGIDAVEFGFAPNVGEPMRPLRAIASSGEISRVMLATKAVLAAHDRIPVLVFDEIDANVGGEMGNAVGQKLRGVAQGHQVLCITHLPQVAVYGETHFVVAKAVHDNRTFTTIEPLSDATRAEEIARMLGGRDLTRVTLEHARQMLEGTRTASAAKPQRARKKEKKTR